MERRWAKRASAVALAFGAALAGMGFDLGNAAWAATVPSVVAVAVHPVVLSGIAVQGPMVASAVTLYLVNPTNGASSAALRTVPTDGLGNLAIGIQAQRYPMRLVARGGSFRSEMDGSTIVSPSAVSLLLPARATSLSGISINPMTTFIDALARARLNAGGTTLTAALSSATAKIESYYGLSTDPGTLAPDYTAVGVGTDAGKLGLILGALINEDQHLCPGKPGGLIAALKADISDGHFDGRKAGVAVSYCGESCRRLQGPATFRMHSREFSSFRT
jgi:hypothetical protein